MMNPAKNRYALKRLLIVFLIGLVVQFVLGASEAGLRSWLDYPYYGPIHGAAGGFVMFYLVFMWRGGYPKEK